MTILNFYFSCLLYFDCSDESISSNITIDRSTRVSIGPHETVLLTCPIPQSINKFTPKAVSIIYGQNCPKKLNNLLRIKYEKSEDIEEKFAVCCKAFRFSTIDLSVRLIEWLELLRILGVNKVFLYSLSMHKNMEKVINYYQKMVNIFYLFIHLFRF